MVTPPVVLAVLSPSTTLTDLRVKPTEYAGVSSIQAYVTLDAVEPDVIVRRRASDWKEVRE